MTKRQRAKRTSRVEALGRTVNRLTGRVFGKRGMNDGAIARHWPEIAGETLARVSVPEKIAYEKGERTRGTLQLRVSNSALATEIQHSEPIIVERINTYFGYQAVARLRLIHGPVPPSRAEAPPRRPLTPDEETTLEGQLSSVEDEDIKAALEGLGRAMAARKSR